MIQQFSILHCSTQNKMSAVCKERLIKDHLGYLHSAVNVIVQNEISSGGYGFMGGASTNLIVLVTDLSNLCKLLSCVAGALDPLVTAFEEHVKNKGIRTIIMK